MLRNMMANAGLVSLLVLAGCVTPQSIEQPRVALQNVRILNAEGLLQRLEIDLLVSNPNDFDIPLTGLDVALQLNGMDFADGLSNKRVTIPRLGSATVPVEVSVSLVAIFQQIQALQHRESLDYSIGGKIYLDNVLLPSVPFDKSGSLDLRNDSAGRRFQPI